MIILYHGSNMNIDKIDLSMSKKGKDFGHGFYLNADKEQAYRMAVRTSRRMLSGEPVVNAFSFDESLLAHPSDFNIKIFDDYSAEWAEFVLINRRNKSDISSHSFDIVVGPIANDTVGVQIQRFMKGYIDMDRLIEELKYHGNHAIQYFFGTERAISLLQKIKI